MYKEEIDRCNILDQLFKVWKKAQIDECDESFKKTYFNYDVSRKYIFSKDGFLGNEDKAKVLFVCREPHIYDTEKSKDEKNGKFFWVKECAVKNKSTEYYNLPIKCLEDLKLKSTIDECAYININKRGGDSTCDMNRLKTYAETYRDFIVKEVEIINPEIVIFLGKLDNSIYEIVKVGCADNTTYYLYLRHHSRYWKKLVPERLDI